jgi:hypothetical protein
MKRVIRSRETGKFITQNGWTDNINLASDFESSLEAIEFCHRRKLKEVELVFSFDQGQKFDLAVPLFLA